MSEHQGATLLQVLGEGFSAPLVGLCALAGVVIALAGRERPPGPPDGTDEGVVVATTEPATATDGAAPPPAPDAGDPARPATAADLEALIDAGEFARAERWGRTSGLDALADQAMLLDALTRGIDPGPLASTSQLLRVTTTEGEVLLGILKAETGDRLTLVLRDGRERALSRAGVRQREALAADAAGRALDDALRRERQALGAHPPGLALHRLAHGAFAAGRRGAGARLLMEALRTPEGQVLVDMFGTGDVERLHAARRRLAAAPAPATSVDEPVAALPDAPVRTPPPFTPTTPDPAPRPDPTPRPDPEPVAPTPPEPEPEPEPAAPQVDLEQVFAHPSWRGAETAYRTGLQLYRSAFDASPEAAGPSVRAALAQFRQAQDLLDRLFRELPDAVANHEVERRVVELNALVLDCTKRLGTH